MPRCVYMLSVFLYNSGGHKAVKTIQKGWNKMGLFDFLKKGGSESPDHLSKDEIGLLAGALSAAAGKQALLDNLRNFGRGPMGMGPNALMATMQKAASDKENNEFATLAEAIRNTGKLNKAQAVKYIEAVESRLADLKDDDSEKAKQKALLAKLKAL